MSDPHEVVVGPDGTIFFRTGARIRAIDSATGVIRTVAGRAESRPGGLVFRPDGKLYVLANGGNGQREGNRIVVVDVANGRLTRFAGASAPDSGDLVPPLGDGAAPDAVSLAGAAGVAVAPEGTVYFTGFANRCLRRIGPPAPPVPPSR